MLIDLRTVKTYVINLDKDTERLERTSSLLESLDMSFERFPGIQHQIGVVGCGLSHFKLLQTVKPPVLILEDDIGVTKDFDPILEIPQEADAVYLGVSKFGFVRTRPDVGLHRVVLASKYTPEYKRPLNMCSTHAILYLSEDYVEASRIKIYECLTIIGMAFDLGLASIHKDHLILTPNSPFFYQLGQKENTLFDLEV